MVSSLRFSVLHEGTVECSDEEIRGYLGASAAHKDTRDGLAGRQSDCCS